LQWRLAMKLNQPGYIGRERQRGRLLRRVSRPLSLPASSQVGGRISLSKSDRYLPRFTALSGTQRARYPGACRRWLIARCNATQ
jgi:hypothetical protein